MVGASLHAQRSEVLVNHADRLYVFVANPYAFVVLAAILFGCAMFVAVRFGGRS